MNTIIEALVHTPWWVYVVLYVLIQRGVAARRANVAPLWRLAILPVLFAGLDIEGIIRNKAISAAMLPLWLVGLAAGAALGHALVRHVRVRADHAHWLIGLPGDATVLPLILVIFALKYAVSYTVAAAPALAQETAFLVLVLLIGGFCTGIFAGRFGTYAVKFRRAAGQSLTPGAAAGAE